VKGLARVSHRLRGRLAVVLIPVVLAGAGTLAAPNPVLAAGDFAETAVTTYHLDTAANRIDVISLISIKNNKKSSAAYDYYWPGWYVTVPLQAGTVKATSNAGAVKQTLYKKTATTRVLLMTFPRLWYRETRVLTIAYSIPAGPQAAGGFRSLRAFARLCAQGVGIDSGVLNVEIPDGFEVRFTGGHALDRVSATAGFQTFSSGSVNDATHYGSCLEATNMAGLTATRTTSTPAFNIQAWPEDAAWAATITAEAPDYAARLETLTGLKMPAGPITIQEAGLSVFGEYAGTPGSAPIAIVTEDADHSAVAHSLAHILFNRSVFAQDWMAEGFAGYSERIAGPGNYQTCGDPGGWPTEGYATLDPWTKPAIDSTTTDLAVVAWQRSAACYLIATLADSMGPDGFKAVAGAVTRGEIAYAGAGTPEAGPTGLPIDARELLDVIDERGLFPAGTADPDQAGNLFSRFGIVEAADLPARSQARSAYHALVKAAGTWNPPYTIRGAMAGWDFPTARVAIDTATEIVALRDKVTATVSGLSLDDSALRTAFEGARTQADMDAALALARKLADAAELTVQARNLDESGRSIFQTVGLLGSDPSAEVKTAMTAMAAGEPDKASASAQRAIDLVNGASTQGMVRLGVIVALLLTLLFAILMVALRRRQIAMLAAAEPPAR
jgi:hypothetical protein